MPKEKSYNNYVEDMKKLTILMVMLMAINVWAYNETDLMKLKLLNDCAGCDLSQAVLSRTNFKEGNLL